MLTGFSITSKPWSAGVILNLYSIVNYMIFVPSLWQMQGREEGGSGVPLDREAYETAVQYWDSHAGIVAGKRSSGK